MFIGKDVYNTLNSLINNSQDQRTKAMVENGELRGRIAQLEAELSRVRNDIKWFMHRLNQVEQERSALVFQATGTRIAAPQFREPDPTPSDILNAMGAPFAGVGEDSPDPKDQLPEHQDGSEDYSHLPGFKGK